MQKSIYFPNLNSIRFIAALLVIIHHIEQFKSVFNIYPNGLNNPVISSVGPLGVRLFFVLSGFLITYLLFAEKEVSGTISIRKFYIRRALRIWPLYYLIVVLAFFIVPHFFPGFISPHTEATHSHPMAWKLFSISLFVFFLPNFALVYIGIVPFASHLWSIGTEEQFYFIWPVLMKFFKNKFVLLLSVVLFYLGASYVFYLFQDSSMNWIRILGLYWKAFPIDNMAIGGIFALIVYSGGPVFTKIKSFIFNRYLQVLVLVLVLAGISCSVGLPVEVLNYECYAILFGIPCCKQPQDHQPRISVVQLLRQDLLRNIHVSPPGDRCQYEGTDALQVPQQLHAIPGGYIVHHNSCWSVLPLLRATIHPEEKALFHGYQWRQYVERRVALHPPILLHQFFCTDNILGRIYFHTHVLRDRHPCRHTMLQEAQAFYLLHGLQRGHRPLCKIH